MKPFIKAYTNDEQLKTDVSVLKDKGINKDDVYVISHDEDRTERVAGGADAKTIGMDEMDFSDYVGTMFKSQGDELRTKLKDIGFSQEEAEQYEEEMDEGKIFLIVTNNENVMNYLA
ncbi:general stress protein [Virgibacillus xinjiangensis]|uniref:General stress protein n=1 Tax=Virgibacillus xinjiangensis TaxID=393090 RepID=A0ABV7CUH5_9BACI